MKCVRKNSKRLVYICVWLAIYIHASSSLPLLDYFSSDPTESRAMSSDDAENSTAVAEVDPTDDGASTALIRYDTVMPVLKVVLTPIGRMFQPIIEQWLADRFGPYIDSIGRAVEGISRYATDNFSFQTGDTYYTKHDLLDGYGYNSLIITLASGRTFTILTHKSNRKMNILDEFPHLTEALNEVRNLN
ncbi:uncharacterized protein LOC128740583 [Sabethes cyaneus]|uniref:uncharacterized protein LOC128740583 n=1 Tax=Sabethes cyaneus TaxID=53552 RepID=UPI00237E781D|nr:uncharacterized protein LOC128740583 [Sabethes cyaneus]